MAILKGFNAAVNGVGSIFRWMVDAHATENPAPNSATQNLANELEGVTDWTGLYMAHGHTPTYNPNGTFTFSGTVDQSLTADCQATGDVKVQRWQVYWNWATNSPIWHQVWFGGNGALTFGDAAVTDATSPAWFMSADTKVYVATAAGGTVTFSTELENVVAASITYEADVSPYVNSGTANANKRVSGCLRWMVDLACHVSDISAMRTLNGSNALKITTDAATPTPNGWVSQNLLWKRLGNIDVQVPGDKIVAVHYRGYGAGWVDVSGTWTKGKLVNPAGTSLWPPA